MHIVSVAADRFVFEVENITVMRYFLVTHFHPAELQSIYFLDRESDDALKAGWLFRRLTRSSASLSLKRRCFGIRGAGGYQLAP
jgi:hypothetical protein